MRKRRAIIVAAAATTAFTGTAAAAIASQHDDSDPSLHDAGSVASKSTTPPAPQVIVKYVDEIVDAPAAGAVGGGAATGVPFGVGVGAEAVGTTDSTGEATTTTEPTATTEAPTTTVPPVTTTTGGSAVAGHDGGEYEHDDESEERGHDGGEHEDGGEDAGHEFGDD